MSCANRQPTNTPRGFAMLVAAGLLALAQPAFAQDVADPPQAPAIVQSTPPEPATPEAQPARRPGFFKSVGHWFDQRGARFREHLRGAKDSANSLGGQAVENTRAIGGTAAQVGRTAVGNAVEATKDAVGAVGNLATARVMKGHERCGVAPNGAPDCLVAAQELCRKHGFSTGKSMDFTSAEECPAKVYLPGRQTAADCTTVTFISRAMCQ